LLNNYDFINITNGKAFINGWLSNLAIDSNVKVFTDGYDSVGLFGKENNNITYRFYSNSGCIQDIDVHTENRTSSSIYVVDSCKKNVKQYVYTTDMKIFLKIEYKIKESGKPVSSLKFGLNRLIVLDRHPNKLILFDI